MVCHRCIEAVRKTYQDLALEIKDIQLGQVTTNEPIPVEKKKTLTQHLEQLGFEVLDNKHAQLLNRIKAIIIDQIHHQGETLSVNFSTLLTDQLHYDYAHLSRLFSSIEGKTIEKFIIAQKIEKVKELLTYGQLSLSEIAFDVGYSSTAHLSRQFKATTGMTPTAFKKLQRPKRQPLDEL
jgi:AraC-like DNA-binding protein